MTELSSAVVIRVRDRERTLPAALDSVRAQTVRPQIVVVDSGSTDNSVAVARAVADAVIEIRPEDFSYGRALNVGAAATHADVVFALSAHVVAPSQRWVERWLDILSSDPTIAAVCGGFLGREESMAGVGVLRTVTSDPYVGFSNTCAAFRRDVWLEEPFDEQLPACEDKEWAARVARQGRAVAFDRQLLVDARHRRTAGAAALLERARREGLATARWTGKRPVTSAETFAAWWHADRVPELRGRVRRRLDVARVVELTGRMLGERAAAMSVVHG